MRRKVRGSDLKPILFAVILVLSPMMSATPDVQGGPTERADGNQIRGPGSGLTTSSWEELPSMDIRDGIAWTTDPDNGDIYLFGGRTLGYPEHGPGNRMDLWRYNYTQGEWMRLDSGRDGPGVRSKAFMALDHEDDVLYICGGVSEDQGNWVYHKDLWSYDLETGEWRRLLYNLGEHISEIGYDSGVLYGISKA